MLSTFYAIDTKGEKSTELFGFFSFFRIKQPSCRRRGHVADLRHNQSNVAAHEKGRAK
jgi:hypothetical protein